MKLHEKAVVLLSGGMDSTTAYYWALKKASSYLDVVATLHINYGQRGFIYEARAVQNIRNRSGAIKRGIHQFMVGVDIPAVRGKTSALLDYTATLNPDYVDGNGMPTTFVPGRNFIFIALATALCYQLDAYTIVGGWTAVDNDYPDCREDFLDAAADAADHAFGIEHQAGPPLNGSTFNIAAPLINRNKANIIKLGSRMGVPWELTRSCYADVLDPCMQCDSCIKRMEAFSQVRMRDPLVPQDQWNNWLLTAARTVGLKEASDDEPEPTD